MYSENEDIREMQEEILILLKEFHEICMVNEIKYTLHGGSMLGAIREKGFISWDDDADIALLRIEYEKLSRFISKDVHSEIYLDNFSDKMYKVWMKRDGHPKVWIDIFVYDYISEIGFAQKLKIAGITLLTPFAKNEVSMQQFRVNGRATGIKKAIYEFIYLLGKNVQQRKKVEMIDNFEQKAFRGKKLYIHRSNDQLFAMKMIIKAEYMEKYILIKFEDTELMISANYHEILVSSYGNDYMTPKKVQGCEEIHDIARKEY